MPFPNIAQDFELAAQVLKSKEQKNTLDDLNHERSGVDTGRLPRFLNKDNASTQSDKRRKANERMQHLTALQMLLESDPEYAKLYNNVVGLLTEAEIKADNVLEICRQKLEEAERIHQANLDKATRMSNGKAVFKDDDGMAYDEQDQPIALEIAEGIIWKEGSPSRNKFKAGKELLNQSQEAYDKAYHERYSVLGGIREKVENQNDPLQKDELNKIHDYLLDKANVSVKRQIDSNITENIPESGSSLNIEKPQL